MKTPDCKNCINSRHTDKSGSRLCVAPMPRWAYEQHCGCLYDGNKINKDDTARYAEECDLYRGADDNVVIVTPTA